MQWRVLTLSLQAANASGCTGELRLSTALMWRTKYTDGVRNLPQNQVRGDQEHNRKSNIDNISHDGDNDSPGGAACLLCLHHTFNTGFAPCVKIKAKKTITRQVGCRKGTCAVERALNRTDSAVSVRRIAAVLVHGALRGAEGFEPAYGGRSDRPQVPVQPGTLPKSA